MTRVSDQRSALTE
jgi:putative ABC transport system substrate-binding protein